MLPGSPTTLVVCPVSGDGVLTVVVVGDADLASSKVLREALLAAVSAAAGRRLILDVFGLRFCDLLGMDALRDGLAAARATGLHWTLQGVSSRLQWLFATFPEPAPAGLDTVPRPLAS